MFGGLRRVAFTNVQRVSQVASLPKSGAAPARLKGYKGGGKGLQSPPQSLKDRTAMMQAAAQAGAAAGARAAAARVPTAPPSGVAVASPAAPAATAPAAPAPAAPAGTWRDFVGIATLLTAVFAVMNWLSGSRSSTSFRERRVAAVKERLKATAKATPQERAVKGSDEPAVPLFQRASAMAVVDIIVRTAGLYMFCSPKGEGKTSLMKQLAQEHPFVIRVDLQEGSLDGAVRAVAAAIGYSLD